MCDDSKGSVEGVAVDNVYWTLAVHKGSIRWCEVTSLVALKSSKAWS